MLRRLLKQRRKSSGHEIELGDIGPVLVCPEIEGGIISFEKVVAGLLARFAYRSSVGGGDAGVVDEDAEPFFTGFDLFDERGDGGFAGDVACRGDYFAGDVLAVGLDYRLEEKRGVGVGLLDGRRHRGWLHLCGRGAK